MSELNFKPCPFCGRYPNPVEFRLAGDSPVLHNKYCDCWASFSLKEWNNRPIESALNARIAALEALISQECPSGFCSGYLTCHAPELDKNCIHCPRFELDESIIEKYIERIKNNG